MSDLRPLSASVSQLTSATFSKKFVALGRILSNWNDIIGPEMAVKTQPVKIIYRKPKDKNEKPQATLEIAATSADATLLHYQKGLILERINQIFGDSWITSLKFMHVSAPSDSFSAQSPIKVPKPVNEEARRKINELLSTIEDEDIRKSLEKLGQSVLKKEQQK